MKNPGPVFAGSEYHDAVIAFSKALAKRFEISHIAAAGQVLKFDEAIGRVCETNEGMSSLVIECNGTPKSTISPAGK